MPSEGRTFTETREYAIGPASHDDDFHFYRLPIRDNACFYGARRAAGSMLASVAGAAVGWSRVLLALVLVWRRRR